MTLYRLSYLISTDEDQSSLLDELIADAESTAERVGGVFDEGSACVERIPPPECGHSACRQNWIDTGEQECVRRDPITTTEFLDALSGTDTNLE